MRCLCVFAFSNALAAAAPAWLTGPKFRAAMQEPFAASWRNVPLREVLHQVEQQTHVAILLDRRIDPSTMPEVNFTGVPLRDGFGELANQLGIGVSTPENVVYLGPADAVKKLRTLIALREQELKSAKLPKLRSKRTVRWHDLDVPRDIVERLASEAGLTVVNPEAIEHDLWAAAELPQVDAITALSLVLIQFDLTFAWRNDVAEIELVPVPSVVQIERSHRLRSKSPDEQLAAWREQLPDAEFVRKGAEVLVIATIEEHESLDTGPAKPRPKPTAGALANQKFSLKIKDVSVRDLMAELEKSDMKFDYDAEELKKAGVDLGRFIELDVEQLPARKFFEAVFAPLKVRAEIEGSTVKLSPER